MKKKYFFILFGIKIVISFCIIISLGLRSKIKEPFENFLALSRPELYLKNELLKIDTIIIRSHRNNRNISNETSIIGKIDGENIVREIFYAYHDDSYKKLFVKKNNYYYLKIVKNVLNNNIFFEDNRYIRFEKRSCILQIYFIFFPIILIIIFLIKSKTTK